MAPNASIHTKTTLVNFRCLPKPLSRFDQACSLAGKTRTDMLINLMERYVATASASIREARIEMPARIDSEAISRPIRASTVSGAGEGVQPVQNRSLKRFSDFLGFGRSDGGVR